MNLSLKLILPAIICVCFSPFVIADCFTEQGYQVSAMGSGNSLTVLSCPAGAAMYLDGMYSGTTPLFLQSIPNGTHSVRLSKSGYNDWQGTADIKETEPVLLKATLESVYRVVSILSNPPGAEAWVDDIYAGITPLTLTNLFPGGHYVSLKKVGYWNYNTFFSTGDGDKTVYATMIPTLFTPRPTSIPTTALPTVYPTIAEPGSIALQSVPSGASTYLDGQYSGVTPITLSSVQPGNRNLEIRLTGYNTWQTGVSVTPGTVTSLSITLTKSGSGIPNGYYAVHSNVNGAKVYFDDKLKGTINNNGLTLKAASTQYQTYRVEMKGYDTYYGEISDIPQNGGIAHLDAMLIKTNYYGREPAWYVIRTNLNGAKVYFDGKYMGTTKNYGFVVQVYPATTQYSRYKVTYPGYRTVEDVFTEAPDLFGTVDVDVTLLKN